MATIDRPLLSTDLDGIFRPSSVAIYGISDRTSLRIAENMTVAGVPFYGINPTREEACGIRCYPSIGDCPAVPEMVVMGVGHGRIEDAIGDVLSLGPRIGFRTVVSAGNETVTDVADMTAYFAEDPQCRVVGLFLETVRRPAAFEAALRQIAEAGKVAIVLK